MVHALIQYRATHVTRHIMELHKTHLAGNTIQSGVRITACCAGSIITRVLECPMKIHQEYTDPISHIVYKAERTVPLQGVIQRKPVRVVGGSLHDRGHAILVVELVLGDREPFALLVLRVALELLDPVLVQLL